MAHNSGKGTDGAGATSTGINSISLPWTTDVQPQTGAVDAGYSTDYYRVHGYQPGRQHGIARHYPTIETSLSHEYDDWTDGILGASSTLALPGVRGAAQPHILEDDLSSSQFQAYTGNSQGLPAMLHQDRWHIPNFFGDVDLEAGLTEDITDFMVPRSTSSSTCPHAGAGVSAEAEAGPSSAVFSASGHDSLHTALDPPAEDSSKKRKRALDLESDTENVSKIAAHCLKKRRVRNPSPTPVADSEQGDVAENSSTMNAKQIVKQKTRQSKVLSSRDYRKRTSSAIASLRERVFPGSVKKGTRRRGAAVSKNMDKDENNETSELDVISEACEKIDDVRAKIKQLEDSNQKLKDSYKELEDYIKELEARNKMLEDNIKVLNDGHAAAHRQIIDRYGRSFESLDSGELRA